MHSNPDTPSCGPARALPNGKTGGPGRNLAPQKSSQARHLLGFTALVVLMCQAGGLTPAHAQNAALNSKADTVSGLNAIPTDLPGSARRSAGNTTNRNGPLNLLELAKARHKNAGNTAYSQTPPASADPRTTDFLLSSRYRNDKLAKSGTPKLKRPADANVIQASIMQSNNGQNAPASQWTQPRIQNTAPVKTVTPPTISKPVIAPPTPPATAHQPASAPQNSQIITPWGNKNSDTDAVGTTNGPRTGNTGINTQKDDPAMPPVAGSSAIFALPLAAPERPQSQPPEQMPTAPAMTKPHQATTQSPSPQANMHAPAIPAPDRTAAMPPVTNGDFVMQLGAFRTAISAETYWASFAIRYPDLAAQHHHYLGVIDLGEKGRFHRLRIGGFASLAQAKEKCRQLAADGTACIGLPR